MRDWLAYWRKKAKGCKHVWGEAWRPTKNPNTGPLIMYCPNCGLPYYRMLQLALESGKPRGVKRKDE